MSSSYFSQALTNIDILGHYAREIPYSFSGGLRSFAAQCAYNRRSYAITAARKLSIFQGEIVYYKP
jgi:predicted metallopeptidase